jgi:A/G-specific adenine glycosylase
VFLLTDGRRFLLERRPPIGIWGGLLALPEGTGESAESFAQRHGCDLLGTRSLPPLTHVFTHFRLTLDVLRCDVDVFGQGAAEPILEWLPLEEVAAAALPAPIRKLLQSAMNPTTGS